MILEYVASHNGGLPGPAEGGWYSCYDDRGGKTVNQVEGGTDVLFAVTFSRGNVEEAAGIETEAFA